MERRLQHVFFDVTDTMLRVRGSVGAVYAPIAARHGKQVAPPEIDRAFRAAIASAPPPAFPGADPADLDRLERAWWHDIVRRTFEPLGPFARFEPFFDAVFEAFRTTAAWEPLPGLRATLEALHTQGRTLGIISELDARLYDALEAFDLRRYFGPIVLSMRTGAAKRDGELFRLALTQTRIDPATAAHVGDSLRLDVQGALTAGIQPIWFDVEGRGGAPSGVPAIRALSELPALLSELERATS